MTLGLLALSLLFFVEGLTGVSRFIVWLFQCKRGQSWLSVPGKIVWSDLQIAQVRAGGRKSLNIDGSARFIAAYVPNILYEYRTNAELFQSRQIFIGPQLPSSFRSTSGLTEQYPVGKEVTVFYNPEKPEVAVLDRNHLKGLLWYLLGGVLYMLIGFAFLLRALHE